MSESIDSNLKSMLHHVKEQADIAVRNNVAHATVTTNAWRDAITQLTTAASGLSLLAMQAYVGNRDVPNLLSHLNASATLSNIESQLTNMKLVFDTATRQKLLREAVAAVKEARSQISDLEKKPAGPAPAGGYSGGTSGKQHSSFFSVFSTTSSSKLLIVLFLPSHRIPSIAPLKVQHQPFVRPPAPPPGTVEEFPVLKKGTSIKPSTFLTFSSAESSASARLGVGGYCAVCSAPRTPDT
jgi:hypothetical protein